MNLFFSRVKQIANQIIKVLVLGKDNAETPDQVLPHGIDSKPIKEDLAVYAKTASKEDTIILGYIKDTTVTESGETRFYASNTSGNNVSEIYMRNNGDITLNNEGSLSVNSDKDINIECQDDYNLSSEGKVIMYSNKNTEIDSDQIIKLNGNQIQLNGNLDFLIKYNILQAINTQLASDINLNLASIATAIISLGGSYSPTPIVIDLTPSKVETVKV